MTRIAFALITVLSVALTSTPGDVGAQSRGAGGPVLVALLDQPLPQNARALVVRHPRDSQLDLVVLSPGGDVPAALGGALLLVRKLRAAAPVATRKQVLTVSALVAPSTNDERVKGNLKAFARRLESAERRDLATLGRARVIQLPTASAR